MGNKRVAKIQTDPIVRALQRPENAGKPYSLYVIPCMKQCDSSSCGIYCIWWFFAILFCRHHLLKISCQDIREFRTLIRRWILLLMFVSSVY